MRKYRYKTCAECGAYLDAGEICDCTLKKDNWEITVGYEDGDTRVFREEGMLPDIINKRMKANGNGRQVNMFKAQQI